MAVQDPLYTTLHNAFTIARRKIIDDSAQKQRIRVRPQTEYGAVISRIFRKKGYGFLVTDSGRSIFFHRSSVVGDEFDLLEEGTGVWFIEREGEKGPWASTVRICSSAP
jgi:cold shock CspA family protein